MSTSFNVAQTDRFSDRPFGERWEDSLESWEPTFGDPGSATTWQGDEEPVDMIAKPFLPMELAVKALSRLR